MYKAKSLKTSALCIALLLASTTHAANRALLVGVGPYRNDKALPGIAIDLSIMRQWAPRLGFTNVEVLQDQQATHANVHAALQRLISNLGPGDRALFYFSGHGAQFKDNNGDEHDGMDEALILHDADMTGEQARNVLLDDEIGGLIASMQNGQLIMLVDACHSGTVEKSISNRGLARLEPSPHTPATTGEVKGLGYFDMMVKDISVGGKNRDPIASARYVALNAAQDNELSLASSSGSLFTLGLNEAFKAAVVASSSITPQGLRDQTVAFIKENVKREQWFSPQLQGDPELFSKDIRVVTSTRENQPGEMWTLFETLMQPYSHPGLTLATDQGKRVKIGQWYTLQLQMPPDLGGYLSVVAIDSGREEVTVLFPNDWMGETRFAAGATVKLPPSDSANWGLMALQPASTTLLVALVTPQPLQLHEQGIRESRLDSKQKVFAKLSPAGLWAVTTRSTAAVAKPPASADHQAAAAKMVIEFYQ